MADILPDEERDGNGTFIVLGEKLGVGRGTGTGIANVLIAPWIGIPAKKCQIFVVLS